MQREDDVDRLAGKVDAHDLHRNRTRVIVDSFFVGLRIPVLETGKKVMTPFARKMDLGIETRECCEVKIGSCPELAQHRVKRIGPTRDRRTEDRFRFRLVEVFEDHEWEVRYGVGQGRPLTRGRLSGYRYLASGRRRIRGGVK